MGGYRDDFYIPGNIIGFTGDVDSDPTVYFQRGNEVGHITQAHDIAQNVGREEVKPYAAYSIGNNASGRCVEKDGTRLLHESRNAFVPIAGLGFSAKYKLGLAITNHTQKKQIGDLPPIEQIILVNHSDTITAAHRKFINKNRGALKAKGLL